MNTIHIKLDGKLCKVQLLEDMSDIYVKVFLDHSTVVDFQYSERCLRQSIYHDSQPGTVKYGIQLVNHHPASITAVIVGYDKKIINGWLYQSFGKSISLTDLEKCQIAMMTGITVRDRCLIAELAEGILSKASCLSLSEEAIRWLRYALDKNLFMPTTQRVLYGYRNTTK